MLAIALGVIILNFLDAVLTQAGLVQGVVTELNPILASLYRHNPGLTFAGKLLLVPLGVSFVAIVGQGKRWAFRGLVVCLCVYLIALGLHLLWLAEVFLS